MTDRHETDNIQKTDSKIDAVGWLLDNIDQLIYCINESKGNEKRSWELFTGLLPDIEKFMTFNTYRTKATTIVRAWRAAIDRQKQTDIQRTGSDNEQTENRHSFNLEGWHVRQAKDGFWRAFKKIKGKTRCLYIGKDPNQAQDVILQKQARIKEWHS